MFKKSKPIIQNKPKVVDIFDFFLIGEKDTGKTCLLNRYCNDFYSSYKKKKKKPEIFITSTLTNNLEFKLQFWDLFLTEDNLDSHQKIIKKSDGIIFVCSLDKKESIDYILKMYDLLKNYDDFNKKQKILFVNKNDLEDGIQISEEDIKKLSNELKVPFYKMSARTGNLVKKGFAEFIHRAITQIYNYEKMRTEGMNSNNQGQNEKCIIL